MTGPPRLYEAGADGGWSQGETEGPSRQASITYRVTACPGWQILQFFGGLFARGRARDTITRSDLSSELAWSAPGRNQFRFRLLPRTNNGIRHAAGHGTDAATTVQLATIVARRVCRCQLCQGLRIAQWNHSERRIGEHGENAWRTVATAASYHSV